MLLSSSFGKFGKKFCANDGKQNNIYEYFTRKFDKAVYFTLLTVHNVNINSCLNSSPVIVIGRIRLKK